MTDLHTELVTAARAAHARRDWHGSYSDFARANAVAALTTDDLDALSSAAWRIGEAKEAVRIAERVFAQLARSDPNAAARKAVELALAWLTRGDLNIAAGWMNRARRLLDGAPESPTHGYLIYLDAVVAVLDDDLDTLTPLVADLRAMSGRLDVPALTALAMVAEAIEAVYAGRMSHTGGLLDEVMLPLLAVDVPIDWAGDIYCIVLHICYKVADLPRMRPWVYSMERWCAAAGSDTYGGVCDVHRLQVRAATDDYQSLENQLAAASQMLENVNSWAAGEGFYQLGEVRRLRGDADGAFAAYARARASGVDPQPGEALLRCRLGQSQAAWADLRVALTSAGRLDRLRPPAGRCRDRFGAWAIRGGRALLPRTGGRCGAIRHRGLPGVGGPRARRGARPGRTARRGARQSGRRVTRIPRPAVALRDRRGLRVDGVGAPRVG